MSQEFRQNRKLFHWHLSIRKGHGSLEGWPRNGNRRASSNLHQDYAAPDILPSVTANTGQKMKLPTTIWTSWMMITFHVSRPHMVIGPHGIASPLARHDHQAIGEKKRLIGVA